MEGSDWSAGGLIKGHSRVRNWPITILSYSIKKTTLGDSTKLPNPNVFFATENVMKSKNIRGGGGGVPSQKVRALGSFISIDEKVAATGI